jgi:hypothetical protein
VSVVILYDPSFRCRGCACYVPVDRASGYCDLYGHNVSPEKESCASFVPAGRKYLEV